jgi:hypothetical protein
LKDESAKVKQIRRALLSFAFLAEQLHQSVRDRLPARRQNSKCRFFQQPIKNMKKLCKFTLVFLFALIFSAVVKAQNSEWTRFASDSGEFSVEMPKNAVYFYDKDGFIYSDFGGNNIQFAEMQMLHAADDKTVMSVEIYRLRSPKDGLDMLLDKQVGKTSKLRDLPKDFSGRQIEKTEIRNHTNDKNVEISFTARFFAAKNHLYVVTVANRGAKNAAFEKFLSSVRFGAPSGGSDAAVKISSLKALGIFDIAADETEQPKPPAPLKKTIQLPRTEDPTPLMILFKPNPSFTNAARNEMTTGLIRARVTFDKSGRVSKVAFTKILENGLSRGAFFAALRLKFIPPEKDGAPQTTTRVVEYNFSIR